MNTTKGIAPTGTVRLACGEMPQARFDHFGTAALSDTELIALILQNGLAPHELLALSAQLMAQAGSLHGLMSWKTTDFQQLRGIGQAKARQLAALVEIGRRMMRPDLSQPPVLNRPELVVEHMAPFVAGLEVEKFWVACLNRKNRLKKLVEISSGTATATLAHPREVFRAAIQQGATAVVCAHNHPSGDPAPSAADVQLTRQLREAAKAVDIDLLDHVVLGRASVDPTGVGFYSFRTAGVL
jgi:DNA repair protein RadC